MQFDIYRGVILPRKDEKNRGRYYVYIPELQFNDLTDNPPVKNKYSGVWCYNVVGNNFVRYTEKELRNFKSGNSYGSYQPLKPGTHVLVGFPVKHNKTMWNIGYIISIITLEPPPNGDRDNFYLLQTTDKESWAYIDESNRTFAMSIHDATSNIWGTDDKIHISKSSGTVVEVADDHITCFVPPPAPDMQTETEEPGYYIHIDQKQIVAKIKDSFIRMQKDHISIKSPIIHIQGEQLVTIEGAQVQINDGIPVPDKPEEKSGVADPSINSISDINHKDKSMHTVMVNGEVQK